VLLAQPRDEFLKLAALQKEAAFVFLFRELAQVCGNDAIIFEETNAQALSYAEESVLTACQTLLGHVPLRPKAEPGQLLARRFLFFVPHKFHCKRMACQPRHEWPAVYSDGGQIVCYEYPLCNEHFSNLWNFLVETRKGGNGSLPMLIS
jgi:hypothetical protein